MKLVYRNKKKAVCAMFMIIALFAATSFAQNNVESTQVSEDPFAELENSSGNTRIQTSPPSFTESGFFDNNFTFKKELYFQTSFGRQETDKVDTHNRLYSRQSVGFEVLKKFSTATTTYASFDFQGRLVRRDNFVPVIDDEEGADREGWYPEYHNAYLDLYNVLNPFLSDSAQGSAVGHFNLRLGRFYLPFGLNQQTDTHGTVLQLSNDRNFGYERDWYAGLWGSINSDFDYGLYYMLGSGYDPSFSGQDGLLGGRVSLANEYLNKYGIEGGVAFLTGQRNADHVATDSQFIQTSRFGLDGRYTHLLADGAVTATSELSAGQDDANHVFTQLYQLDYLHHTRKWGLSSQVRRFHQNINSDSNFPTEDADTSIIGEVTWYFRNDIGNTNLHWIKLNVERQLERMEGPLGTVITVQYYRYW